MVRTSNYVEGVNFVYEQLRAAHRYACRPWSDVDPTQRVETELTLFKLRRLRTSLNRTRSSFYKTVRQKIAALLQRKHTFEKKHGWVG